MRKTTALLSAALLLLTLPVHADQPSAREVARINNCTPKKVEVYQQSLGMSGKTVYRVTCTLPKMVGGTDPKTMPDALLISCDQSLCELMRAVMTEKK